MGRMSPVRITADEDEWQARVAAIDAEGTASPKSASDGGSPKWSRDTAPSVLSAAMESVLSLDEEQAETARRSSPVLSERRAEPPFIAGSTNIVVAPSRGPGSPSPSGGSHLTDSERRARRERRENKRRAKEAANTKRLLAARQAAKQMGDDARKLKSQLRLARRRGMELSHTGGGGHHARFPRSGPVTIGQQVAVGGLATSGSSESLFGTDRAGAPHITCPIWGQCV
eukprot:COSAG02_NODE_4560_length_5216_cov_1.786594_2_plen_228_part_00